MEVVEPIQLLKVSTLMRLLELRPDMRDEIVAELRRRGVQVVES